MTEPVKDEVVTKRQEAAEEVLEALEALKRAAGMPEDDD